VRHEVIQYSSVRVSAAGGRPAGVQVIGAHAAQLAELAVAEVVRRRRLALTRFQVEHQTHRTRTLLHTDNRRRTSTGPAASNAALTIAEREWEPVSTQGVCGSRSSSPTLLSAVVSPHLLPDVQLLAAAIAKKWD